MSHPQVVEIDLDREFLLITQLVNALWDGFDNDISELALRHSFEQGLKDARLWIDEYATYRIAEVLNGNDEICCPLKQRNKLNFEGDRSASFYDALCIFDDAISRGVASINQSVTGYGRWNYSSNAEELCTQLIEMFGNLSISPKDRSRDAQNEIVQDYEGYPGKAAGSLSTLEKLTKREANYNYNEQGRPYFHHLFSAIYSHGLFCAKLKNTQRLVNDLLPIYSKRDEPINFDNGDDILSAAAHNPFVKLIEKLEPLIFYSTDYYLEQRKESEKRRLELEHETEEEKERRFESLLESCLAGMDEEISQEDERINKIIDEVMPSFPTYKLASIDSDSVDVREDYS